MAYRLHYIGADPHHDSLPGIPASDHEVESAAEAALRLVSGHYVLAASGGGRLKGPVPAEVRSEMRRLRPEQSEEAPAPALEGEE